MPDKPPDWEEPRVTSNCRLLAGYIAGALSRPAGDGSARMYRPLALSFPLIVEHENGNRYRVSIEQLAGTE